MLIEFRVKNFRSFRDEQVLSLVAGNDKALEGNCFEAGKHRLLKASAIYGPNASGKSNLIKAVHFMQSVVLDSAKEQPGKPFDFSPFLLDARSDQEPSLFEVTFLLKSVRYQYGFTATRKRIHDEWLIAYPLGRAQRWFEREFSREVDPWKWSKNLIGEKNRLRELTRPNALFLSVAAQFNHEQLTPVYEWFKNSLRVMPPRDLLLPVTAHMLTASALVPDESDHQDFRQSVLRFLHDADLGITDFNIKKLDLDYTKAVFPTETTEEMRKKVLRFLKDSPFYDITMLHRNPETGREVEFKLQDESGGTQRLFELAGPWIESVGLGHTVFVDELESSLHPLLTWELVRFFQNPGTNKEGAQLVFATHDTTLLDPSLLRRDQVWFTEKDNKGASHLYSLGDYKKHRARKGEAMQKRYLAGRYGAVPILKAFGIE